VRALDLVQADHRQHLPVAQRRPGRRAGQRREADLGQVGVGDLRGGEADALEHADPPVGGDHRRRHHVGHDQHRQHQREDGEGEHERGVHVLLAAHLQIGQPGLGAFDRPGRQRAPQLGEVGVDLRGGGVVGEGVEHLLLGRGPLRPQRGDLAGRHPGVLVVQLLVGVAGDGQLRVAGRAGHGDLAAQRQPDRGEDGQGDLTGPGRPAALAVGLMIHDGGVGHDLIQRGVRRRPAHHGQLLRPWTPRRRRPPPGPTSPARPGHPANRAQQTAGLWSWPCFLVLSRVPASSASGSCAPSGSAIPRAGCRSWSTCVSCATASSRWRSPWSRG
jgi:hypothetical protein